MKYLAIFGISALVIGALAYMLIFSVPDQKDDLIDSTNSTSTAETDVAKKVEAPLAGVSTLEALRLRGDDLECVISYIPPETKEKVEGTYFVSDGNIRGDFLTPSPDLGGLVLSSIIINDPMMYIWSEIDGQLYGIKLDLTTTDKAAMEKNEPISLQDNVDYTCKPWENVDRTVFQPPSTVLFQDTSELMKAGMEYGTVYDEQPKMEL